MYHLLMINIPLNAELVILERCCFFQSVSWLNSKDTVTQDNYRVGQNGLFFES